MSIRERILHMLIFEAIALVLLAILGVLTTGKEPLTMTGLAFTLSLIAMGWNYFYNWGFDCIFGEERISRTLQTRIIHGAGFELTLLVVTLPVMMWFLKMDFLTVLLLDLGAVAFFFLYAIIFNWVYDHIRHRMVASTV